VPPFQTAATVDVIQIRNQERSACRVAVVPGYHKAVIVGVDVIAERLT
jgi:hypothetical protein